MLLAQVLVPAATAAAVLFAAWFSLDALRRPNADASPQSATLHDALGPLLLRHLATLAVAVLVSATAAGLAAGYFGDSWRQGALAAGSLVAGAICSGLAVHIGAGLATAVASRAADGTPPLPGAAVSAAMAPTLLAPGLAVGALGGLIGLTTWQLDEPIEHAPYLVVAFALGAGLVAAASRVGSGVAANATRLAASLTPSDSDYTPSLAAARRAASLSFAAASPVEFAGSTVLISLAAVLLGHPLALVSGDEGWLLFPLVLLAVAVLSTIAGGLAAQLLALGPISPGLLLVRALAITLVLGAGGSGAAAWAMLSDDWYWFSGSVAAGGAAAVLLLVLSRRSPLGPWYGARRVARASQTSPASNVLTGFAAGLEAAALAGLTVAAAIAAGYALSAQAGVSTASSATTGFMGIGLVCMGFVLPGLFIGAWSPVAAILAAYDAATPNAPPAEPPAESEDGARLAPPQPARAGTLAHLSGHYAVALASLAVILSFLAFASLIRAELTPVALEDPERYAALAQDLDLLQPGDDVRFAAAHAIAAHTAALRALRESVGDDGRFGPRELEQLAVAPRFEADGIAKSLVDDDDLTPRQAAGIQPSPLPLPLPLTVDLARPEVLAAAFAGVLLAFLAAATAIRGVGRLAGGLLAAASTNTESTPPGAALAPGAVARRAARSTGPVVVPLFAFAIIVPVGLGVSVRYALGDAVNAGWLFVAGLLVAGGIGAVMLAAVLESAGAVWSIASETVAAPREPGGNAEAPDPSTLLASSTGADAGATFRDAAVPALVAFARLAAAAALAFGALFVA